MARAKARTRTTRRVAAPKTTKPGAIPRRIFAHASPHSIGGVSMFAAQEQIHAGTVANFTSRRRAERIRPRSSTATKLTFWG